VAPIVCLGPLPCPKCNQAIHPAPRESVFRDGDTYRCMGCKTEWLCVIDMDPGTTLAVAQFRPTSSPNW
jgi:hypothetical protein